MVYNAVLEYGAPSPGSPPDMTDSRSSKSSSLTSMSSDGGSLHDNAGDFEDIGLEDHVRIARHVEAKTVRSLLSPDFRPKNKHVSAPRLPRDGRKHPAELARRPNTRPLMMPKLQTQNIQQKIPTGLGLFLGPNTSPLPLRRPPTRSSSNVSIGPRAASPSQALGFQSLLVRRSSWQSNRERKTALQLEMECDQDDDDIPDGLILDNVPMSPRPPQIRARSVPGSSPKAKEKYKDRIRSIGNGTPPVAQAQGCLRSPTWKSDTAAFTLGSRPISPMGAKSWSMALADLNAEAKALTEKLEEHSEELSRAQRSSTGSMPRKKSEESKPRVRSAMAELPPLRRTNVMIDPLPVSKEKEAVLSRTRPSWLPPKNPNEERRHLKEYQKMMAHSMAAERRREEARRARSDCRDTAADSIMHMWEDDIVPRWNVAIRERRNRDLWWLGIAPRSRGTVWRKAIGNVLRLTEASFRAALGRAQDSKARLHAGSGTGDDSKYSAWFAAMDKDIEESTWRELQIFQTGGPLHQALRDVLGAYAMYRSDIGYVPGCNTIAAVLLLNLPSPSDAFIALANLLNRALPLSFHACDTGAKLSAYNLLMQKLSQTCPALHQHLHTLPHHDADTYLDDLFTGLFSRHLALDEVTRLWDVYFFEGDAVLIRAAVALLMQKEMGLLGTKSIEEVKTILGAGTADSHRILTPNGAEDRWMCAVRGVGNL